MTPTPDLGDQRSPCVTVCRDGPSVYAKTSGIRRTNVADLSLGAPQLGSTTCGVPRVKRQSSAFKLMQKRTTCSTKTPESFCYLFQRLAGQTESRQKLGKVEATCHQWRDQSGTRGRHRTALVQFEGKER